MSINVSPPSLPNTLKSITYSIFTLQIIHVFHLNGVSEVGNVKGIFFVLEISYGIILLINLISSEIVLGREHGGVH